MANEWQPNPKPFTHKGVRYVPYAVAMYGDLAHTVPLAAVLNDDDGRIWCDHIVMFAPTKDGER